MARRRGSCGRAEDLLDCARNYLLSANMPFCVDCRCCGKCRSTVASLGLILPKGAVMGIFRRVCVESVVAVCVMAALWIAPAHAEPVADCASYPVTGFCAPGGPDAPPGADTGYVPGQVPPDPNASGSAIPDLQPGGDVSGGGPAADAIGAYLPSFNDPSIAEGDGSHVLGWVGRGLGVFNPSVRQMFSVLNALNKCGQRAGIYATRGYWRVGALWAGGIVMISQRALQSPLQYLPECVGLGGDVAGGGPGGGLVCTDRYAITTPSDTYYVAMVGLPGEVCGAIANAHAPYPHSPW